MINRKIHKDIEESLKIFPVVGILGSRQSGKTTLAKHIQRGIPDSIYFDLELPSDDFKLREPELFLSEYKNKLIIIDEIQQRPELFAVLRALIDKDRQPARFIILGSSYPDLIRKSSESLAGRIIYHYLPPFQINELMKNGTSIQKLWLVGGYPESYLADDTNKSFIWRNAFIDTFLERDLPKFGIKIPSIQIRRFWSMLAHMHGSIWNASKISASLGVTSPTVKNYLDILENTFIVRQLQPYIANIKKRLVKSPKVYIRDSGLLHSVLNIKEMDDLFGNPISGYSWEGFIIEQILNNLPINFDGYFYRTGAGAEVDLVITKAEKPVLCVEIKLSLSPQLSQGFFNGMSDMKCEDGIVVYPGNEEFLLKNNIKAVPSSNLSGFLQKHL
ncbi:MAG: ATP-binding protein [bacterium]